MGGEIKRRREAAGCGKHRFALPRRGNRD